MKTLAYIGAGVIGAALTSLFYETYLINHLDEIRSWLNLLGSFIGCSMLEGTIKSRSVK